MTTVAITECCTDEYLGDEFCRAVLFPRGFADGVFDPAQFLELSTMREAKTVSVMSIGSMFLLRTEARAHDYGRLTAQRANDGIAERNGSPPPADKRRRYLGYYVFTRGDAIGLSSALHAVGVECRPDDHNDPVHFQLETYRKLAPGKSDFEFKEDKVAIRIALDKLLRGPLRPPAGADNDDAAGLEHIELPARPEN